MRGVLFVERKVGLRDSRDRGKIKRAPQVLEAKGWDKIVAAARLALKARARAIRRACNVGLHRDARP
ncbi:hypothetical protein CKO11_07900 [Rhodobacter sp. TJ_12]|nr:hypothetical protein [Rhodobacter sp. TJ_12]